jgi:hypothetical protein
MRASHVAFWIRAAPRPAWIRLSTRRDTSYAISAIIIYYRLMPHPDFCDMIKKSAIGDADL